ncbi:MAG: metal-dependent hydrolase [Algiphilus sp.]|uniref:metal-dependent hydrolase n=1 Tax=Algiphilus sp. TaxID=1872431 RepID=UPI0032EE34AE
MVSATVLNHPTRDAAVRPSVPVRHMDFQFDPDSVDTRFYQNAELASAIFESLSIFLTFGEDLVIDTARHHRQFVKDPELKQRVTALIGQEAIHSKMHNAFNDVLAQNRYPVPLYRYLADKVFDYGFKKLPHRLQLSLMAGIEHFTAVLAEYMMEHESIFYETEDEKQRALWMWHMLEESEHKDIAYDVYQELSGNYPLRIAGFALAAFTILVLVPLAGSLIPIWRKPSNLFSLRYWKDARRSITLLAGREDGVFGSSMTHLLAYLRRDFHPNDFENAAQLAYFKDKLLHPETGLLTPYLTREFVPALRAS